MHDVGVFTRQLVRAPPLSCWLHSISYPKSLAFLNLFKRLSYNHKTIQTQGKAENPFVRLTAFRQSSHFPKMKRAQYELRTDASSSSVPQATMLQILHLNHTVFFLLFMSVCMYVWMNESFVF